MRRYLSYFCLFALLVVFRVLGAECGWWNFSPLPALLLLSVVFFRGRDAWVVPVAAWVVSDVVLNVMYGQPLLVWDQLGMILGVAGGLVLVPWLKRSPTVARSMVGAVGAAVVFHVVTNGISFLTMRDLYALSWQGLVQAQWSGPVGFGPTWVFLRNAIAGNMLFSAIFLLAILPISAYFPRPRVSFAQR